MSESPLAGLVLLRDAHFARFVAARFASAFGTAMAPIAMAFGVLELTDSPRAMSVVLASGITAQIAVQLFAGAVADRVPRRGVMVGAELTAMAAQLAMAAALLSEAAPIPLLCLLMGVNGVAAALFWPAAIGFVPQVVDRDDLQAANALISLSNSTAFGLGGASAGILVATAGAGWAIAVDAMTFATSAALIAGIRPRHAAAVGEEATLWVQLREGWTEFIRYRWLWTIVLQFSLVLAAMQGGLYVVGPIVARESLGGASAWGWIAGAEGFGLAAGGLLTLVLRIERPLLVACLGMLTWTLPMIALAMLLPLPLIVLASFILGVSAEMFGVLWYTTLHRKIPPHVISRVSAYDTVGSIALMPLGAIAAGSLVTSIGSEQTLWLAAALIALPTLAVLCVPEVRSLRTPD